MFYKAVSLGLIVVLLQSSITAQASSSPTQSVAQMQQVLRKVQEKDKAVKVILRKKMDNRTKFMGKVSEVSDTNFTVTDQQTGKPMKLAYEDVQQVHQSGMSKGSKIAIGIAIGAAAFIAVGVVACYASRGCLD